MNVNSKMKEIERREKRLAKRRKRQQRKARRDGRDKPTQEPAVNMPEVERMDIPAQELQAWRTSD